MTFVYAFNMKKCGFCLQIVFSTVLVVSLFPIVANADTLNCATRSYINGFLSNVSIPHDQNNLIIQCFGEKIKSSECTLSQFYKINGSTDLADCSGISFSSSGADGFLSEVGILPYDTDDFYNYNISFSNIKWEYVRVRVVLVDREVSLSEGADDRPGAFCAALDVPGGFSPGAVLSLAHRHWGSWAGGLTAQLQLFASASASASTSARFLFRVPAMKADSQGPAILSWVPLVALEVSRRPLLEVVWPRLPSDFNVSSYAVQVQGEKPEEVRTEEACGDLFCRRELDVGRWSRLVKILVQPVHPLCEEGRCVWETPHLHLDFPLPWYFWALLFTLPVLAVLTLVFTLYFSCCKYPSEPLPVLFLLDATEKWHQRAARVLGEFLEETAHVKILYEVEQVPKSTSKNASKWLQEMVEEVPLALVVASPPTHLPYRYTHYPNVFSEALPLLEKRERCAAHRARGALAVVAVPPYLMKDDLPDPLRHLPAFHVPSQMKQLIWTLYNPRAARVPPLRAIAFLWLRVVGCPGPLAAYGRCGSRLAEALTAANAVQVLGDQLPPTPPSDGGDTVCTFPRVLDLRPVKMDTESTISAVIAARSKYPGNLNTYNLAEKESLADSEASAVLQDALPNGATPLEALPL